MNTWDVWMAVFFGAVAFRMEGCLSFFFAMLCAIHVVSAVS